MIGPGGYGPVLPNVLPNTEFCVVGANVFWLNWFEYWRVAPMGGKSPTKQYWLVLPKMLPVPIVLPVGWPKVPKLVPVVEHWPKGGVQMPLLQVDGNDCCCPVVEVGIAPFGERIIQFWPLKMESHHSSMSMWRWCPADRCHFGAIAGIEFGHLREKLLGNSRQLWSPMWCRIQCWFHPKCCRCQTNLCQIGIDPIGVVAIGPAGKWTEKGRNLLNWFFPKNSNLPERFQWQYCPDCKLIEQLFRLDRSQFGFAVVNIAIGHSAGAFGPNIVGLGQMGVWLCQCRRMDSQCQWCHPTMWTIDKCLKN